MRIRLKSVLATLVTTGMVAGMLGFAQVAHAAPPTFEPDPNARGCLNFYDSTGKLVTGGNITDTPIAAFALGDGPSRSGDNAGTLYAAQPAPGVPSQNWLTQQLSAGNNYPSTDPTTPANLRNSPNPLYIGQSGDATVADILAGLPPAGNADDNLYQIRFITNGPSSGTDTIYWRADIQVTGSTWTQTFCPPPAGGPQSTSTGLTVSPPSPQTAGTTVNLTASVTPTAAVGSVQFQDGGANLGPAVSVTAGTATSSTAGLTAGDHSLTAMFEPTDPGAFSASTSAAVPYTITPVTGPATADLSITKTGPATANTGDPLTYTLTATNNGPNDATGVSVADTLPAGVGFVSASSSAGSCTNAASAVTCAIGPLANGASATITIDATAPATAGSITNTATITGNETDPSSANNTASATTDVSAVTGPATADLSITKTGPATANTGDPLTYTLTATNNGPNDATGVIVSDGLPAGVSFVSATPSSCASVLGTVLCPIGSLANGASATITIDATAPATAGSITNTATITGNETDPSSANNTASATTDVSAVTGPATADLSITKTGPATATPTSTISYTLTATNHGPSDATGVVVTDNLPAGVTFVSATTSTCTNASGSVTCDLGDLANGATATITIDATAPAAPGSITNTATITGNETDPSMDNNAATAMTQVTGTTGGGSADLAIAKYALPSDDDRYPSFQVSNTFSYLLVVRNAGPATATGVKVTDQLPAGVTFSKVSTTNGTCTQASGAVTCDLGTLKRKRVAWVVIRVTATAAGRITNTAMVSGDQTDPHPMNNSSSVTITVAKPRPCRGRHC